MRPLESHPRIIVPPKNILFSDYQNTHNEHVTITMVSFPSGNTPNEEPVLPTTTTPSVSTPTHTPLVTQSPIRVNMNDEILNATNMPMKVHLLPTSMILGNNCIVITLTQASRSSRPSSALPMHALRRLGFSFRWTSPTISQQLELASSCMDHPTRNIHILETPLNLIQKIVTSAYHPIPPYSRFFIVNP